MIFVREVLISINNRKWIAVTPGGSASVGYIDTKVNSSFILSLLISLDQGGINQIDNNSSGQTDRVSENNNTARVSTDLRRKYSTIRETNNKGLGYKTI